MSKSVGKKPTPKAKTKLEFVPVGATAGMGTGTQKRNRDLEPAKEHDYKVWGDLVFEQMGEKPTAMLNYLVLHAAHAKILNKGFLKVINCRNVYADGPYFDFLPTGSFGGKVEVWMENVEEGDSFTVQFRVTSYSGGTWNISSSETAQFQTSIVNGTQSIDFIIPPVTVDYGSVLIVIEPVFTNSGSWVFNDVIINKIKF